MASLSLVFDLLARDKASKEFRKVGDAADKAGRQGKGFGSSISGGMKLAAGAIAAAGLGTMFAGFITDAAESQKIARLTSAAIKSTGGAANITAKQVGDLASAISNKTAVDDEAIQSGANLLLTFTKVRNETGKGNDIFNQATQAAVDMSVALGTDVKGASLQLGKALNDPIKGVSALGRAGVSFTAQQKEQIKTMVEAGDTLGAQKIILGEMSTQFGGAAAAAADPLDRLKVIAGNLGEEIGGYLLPIVGRFATWVSDRLIPTLSRWAAIFNEHVVPRLRELGAFVQGTVLPALRNLIRFIVDNREAIATLVAGLVVFKATMGALALATAASRFLAVAKAVGVWRAIQLHLNLALRANPIGIVITVLALLAAGLMVAWKNSETFRKIVVATWKWIKDAASATWNFLKGVFPAWGKMFRDLGAAIVRVWNTMIKAAWNALRSEAQALMARLRTIFAWISNAWSALGRGISNVWRAIIRTAWDAFKSAAQFMWNSVLKPVFRFIGDAWSGLGRTFRRVYDGVIRPVFDTFRRVGGTIREAFGKAIDGIRRLWDGLAATVKRPIQAVVDVVWNNGIRALWNTVNNLWGGDNLAPVRLARGGVMPGYTPGRDVHKFFSPTGGILELSGGEAVMRPEFTKVLGAANIDALNSIARREGEAGLARAMEHGAPHQRHAGGGIISLPGWLGTALSWIPGMGSVKSIIGALSGATGGGGLIGGIVPGLIRSMFDKVVGAAQEMWNGSDARTGGGGSFGAPGRGGSLGSNYQSMFAAISRAFPEARLNSGYRPGDPGYHGRGKAVDIGWSRAPGGIGNAFMASVNQWLYDNHRGSLAELIYNGLGDNRPNWWKGQNYAYSAGTQAQHRNHVHAAVYDRGGLLPSGMAAVNLSGRPERVLNPQETAAYQRQAPVTIYTYDNAPAIVRALDAHERQRAALSARWV